MQPSIPDHLPPAVRAALSEAVPVLHGLFGTRLKHVVLFGSAARGEARDESDVDVLVVLGGLVDYMAEVRRMLDLKMELLDRYGLLVSFKPVSVATYRDEGHPLMMNVHREGALLA